MGTGQLFLFPPPQPLVERLGKDFFRTLPETPGVYLMCGPESGVLYVGSAVNLRRRLCSYRVANPERLSRRIIRLLQRVTRIEYDRCATEAAARAREELLICVLTPQFNRAGRVFPSLTNNLPIAKFQKDSVPLPSVLTSVLVSDAHCLQMKEAGLVELRSAI